VVLLDHIYRSSLWVKVMSQISRSREEYVSSESESEREEIRSGNADEKQTSNGNCK